MPLQLLLKDPCQQTSRLVAHVIHEPTDLAHQDSGRRHQRLAWLRPPILRHTSFNMVPRSQAFQLQALGIQLKVLACAI